MIKVIIGNNVTRTSDIIDETITLREALEAHEIDYSVGMTSLDGCTLNPGDLDKTFEELGVKEKCYLLNVVKAQNAAVVKVLGDAMVVESTATLEQLKTLAKYRPDALKLYDGEGSEKEVKFAVAVAKQGPGAITKYGATFGGANDEGKAIITAIIPEGVTDKRTWVEESVGTAILNLNAIEEVFEGAAEEIQDELNAIRSNIIIM